jgi:hypothetical protein
VRKAREEAEARAAFEKKAREQAEQKAQGELAAKIEVEKKAREEAELQVAAALKAREEAEMKAHAVAGSTSEAALKAREEAELAAETAEAAIAQAYAMAEAATRAKEEAEAKAAKEREARAAAEERAKSEAVTRVLNEQQSRERAEDEINARVAAEIRAKELAEREADVRYRKEAEERARTSAARNKQRNENTAEEAHAAIASSRSRKPVNWLKTGVIGLVILLAATVGLLHLVPLSVYIPEVQKLISQRLQQPVTISGMRYTLLPTPQLTLEQVAVGKLREIKIDNIVVDVSPFALFSSTKHISSAEINSTTLHQDQFEWLSAWSTPQASNQLLVEKLRFKAIRASINALDLPAFDADITFSRSGNLQRALISDGKLRIELAPKDKAWSVNLSARSWQPPLGPSIEFDELTLNAVIENQRATINGIEALLGAGTLKGAARASWSGGIRVEGDFNLTNGNINTLIAAFTHDFRTTGTLNTNLTYVLQAGDLVSLFANPRIEANFTIDRGTFDNIDIVRAVQSPSPGGIRGGRTRFDELTGTLQISGNRYSYRQLRMRSGPMNAVGGFEISQDGDLSGRVSAEVGSGSTIFARSALNISGTVKSPLLRP